MRLGATMRPAQYSLTARRIHAVCQKGQGLIRMHALGVFCACVRTAHTLMASLSAVLCRISSGTCCRTKRFTPELPAAVEAPLPTLVDSVPCASGCAARARPLWLLLAASLPAQAYAHVRRCVLVLLLARKGLLCLTSPARCPAPVCPW